MRFEKKIDSIGKSYIHMNLEGIQLPELEFDYTPLLDFHVDTYSILKANASEAGWNMVFGDVHKFLDLLSPSECKAYALTLLLMRMDIMESIQTTPQIDGKVLCELETRLSKMLADLDAHITLVPRLIEFVENNIPIQSFANVGERAQDTVEMTFYRDDVVKLTAQTLLCKMVTPIFGLFIESCKKRMDNSLKEVHCNAILKDVLHNRLHALTEKLYNFINKIIKPMINKVKLTQIYNGYTHTVILQMIVSGANVRRLVTVDLHKPNGNLVTYITSCARAAAQTQFASTGFKNAVVEIIHPKEQASEEDGNVSNLEAESRSSSKTADFTILARAAVVQLEKRFVIEHELNKEAIEAAQAYYLHNHIAPTTANSYLLGIVFGNDLGGARTIELFDALTLNRIVPIMQAYFIQQGYLDLIHLVSAIPTGQTKGFTTGADAQLAATWNNSYEYRNCDSVFDLVCNDLRWDTGLSAIVAGVTSEVMLFNTAPAFWELMELESKNKEPFVTPESLARSICSLILQHEAVV